MALTPLRIDVVCTDPAHAMLPHLQGWAGAARRKGHDAAVIHDLADLRSGDLLLLAACHDIVPAQTRARYRHALVTHASDLPQGRGWSPLAWTVASGENEITVSLVEAEDKVDAGAIWAKARVTLEGHELNAEINARVYAALIELLDHAVDHADAPSPQPQGREGESYWRRRTPEDSRLDPDKSIASQFDLVRACDPERYPAFFDLRGHRYELILRKRGETPDEG